MKKDDYLSDLEEWQEHQYSKGYYTGGKLPPSVKYSGISGHTKAVTFYRVLLMFFGLCFIIASFIGFVLGSESRSVILILSSVLIAILGVIFFLLGWKVPKRAKRKTRKTNS